MEAIQKEIRGINSLYQQNINYSHYQQNFNIKIIDQPNHPSHCRTDCPARHRQCGGRAREFEPVPDVSPTGKHHRRGEQLRAYLLDSWGGKRHIKGRRHAKGRLFLLNKLQIEFENPKFRSYLRLPSALRGLRYCQYKAPQ